MRSADRYAVIGHPVAHSRSPWIHRAFADATGEAIDYGTLLAPLDAFAATVDAFFDAGGRGLNVTLPFKVDAFDRCAGRVSDRAARAGAVNVLRRGRAGDDRIEGDNVDGVGFVADLARVAVEADATIAGARVLLVGAGGAARGVVEPLFEAGLDRMTIVARDVAKAAALALRFRGRAIDVASFEQVARDRFDIVVNATSAGLAGASLPLSARTLAGARIAYDLAYGAGPTPFMADARRAGCGHAVDGLGMLVEQAAESFRWWRGVRPATAPVLAALRARLDGERDGGRADERGDGPGDRPGALASSRMSSA